jgi:hypothetical protein
MQIEKNLPAPPRRPADAKLPPQRFLEALGGNGEQRRFEPDKIGVGGDGVQTGEPRNRLPAGDDELAGGAVRGTRFRSGILRADGHWKKQRANKNCAGVEPLNR